MDDVCDVAEGAIDLIDAFESVQCPVMLTTQEEFFSSFVNTAEARSVVVEHEHHRLTGPARETRRLQPQRDGRVRCCALLSFIMSILR